MTNPTDVTRQIHRTTITTMALVPGLVFGIILLAAGDWLAGLVIVVVTVVGLAVQIPVIRKLCSTEPPASPPTSKSVS